MYKRCCFILNTHLDIDNGLTKKLRPLFSCHFLGIISQHKVSWSGHLCFSVFFSPLLHKNLPHATNHRNRGNKSQYSLPYNHGFFQNQCIWEKKKQVWRGHFWGTNKGIAIPCVTSCYQRHFHILGLHILINIMLDFLFHRKPSVYLHILNQSWTPCPGEDIFGTNLAIYKNDTILKNRKITFRFFFQWK